MVDQLNAKLKEEEGRCEELEQKVKSLERQVDTLEGAGWTRQGGVTDMGLE